MPANLPPVNIGVAVLREASSACSTTLGLYMSPYRLRDPKRRPNSFPLICLARRKLWTSGQGQVLREEAKFTINGPTMKRSTANHATGRLLPLFRPLRFRPEYSTDWCLAHRTYTLSWQQPQLTRSAIITLYESQYTRSWWPCYGA